MRRPAWAGCVPVSRWYFGGVSVMSRPVVSRWFLGGFLVVSSVVSSVVSWWFLGGVSVGGPGSVVSRWFLGVSWWFFGRVLVVSWWFLGGASVVSRWCLGGVSVVSRWFLGGFLVVFRSCLGGVLLVSCSSLASLLPDSCWSLAGFFLVSCWSLAGLLLVSSLSPVSRWSLGRVLQAPCSRFAVVQCVHWLMLLLWLFHRQRCEPAMFFPNSDSLGLFTLKADGRCRVHSGGVSVVSQLSLGGVSVASVGGSLGRVWVESG